METKTSLPLIKIGVKNSSLFKSVIEEKTFKYYYEELSYSREDFKKELKVGSRIFRHSLNHWYSEEEKAQIKSIRLSKYNRTIDNFHNNKLADFSTALNDEDLIMIKELSKISPDLIDIFNNYHLSETKVEIIKRLYGIFEDIKLYEIWIKDRIYKLRKSLNNKGENLDITTKLNVNFKRTRTETLVGKYFSNRGIDVHYQYRVTQNNKEGSNYYFYDLYLKEYNLLIEIDGPQHVDTIENDSNKDSRAKELGLNLIRIPITKSRHEYKNVIRKIEECLKEQK